MTRTKVGAIEHLNPIKWGKRAKYLWNETFFNKNVKLLKNYVLIEYKNTAQKGKNRRIYYLRKRYRMDLEPELLSYDE